MAKGRAALRYWSRLVKTLAYVAERSKSAATEARNAKPLWREYVSHRAKIIIDGELSLSRCRVTSFGHNTLGKAESFYCVLNFLRFSKSSFSSIRNESCRIQEPVCSSNSPEVNYGLPTLERLHYICTALFKSANISIFIAETHTSSKYSTLTH